MKPVALFTTLIVTFLVAACGGGGSSVTSPSPPTPPSGLVPVAGDTQVQLSWNTVPGATSYNVYYQTTAGVTRNSTKITSASSGKTITGLTDGTTYYFAVTAVNANGESALSSEVSALPAPAPPAAPTAPINLTATAGDTRVTLNWTVVSGATSYNVYYSTTSGVTTKNGTKIANAAPGNAITGLTDGTAYYFVVTAVNSSGESSISNEATATPLPAVLSAPTGVTAAAGDSQAQISWTTVKGAASYNVYYGTASGITTKNGTQVANAASGNAITSLTNGTTYYFVVTAADSYGQESAISSEVSALPSAAPPAIPTAPTNLTATAGDTQVTLNWTAVSGTTYTVYYSTSSGVTTKNGTMVTGIAPGDAITSLSNGTTYYFVVTASNSSGTSPISNEANATPLPPPLSAPTSVTTVAGDTKVTLSWADNGATSYNVYYGTMSGVSSTNYGTAITNATSGTTITGLTNGTTYYFVITAVDSYGQESTISSTSNSTPALWTTSTSSTPSGTLADINNQRDNAANVVINVGGGNRIYVMGGAPAGLSILDSMEMNSFPFTGNWTYKAAMPAWSTFSIVPAWGGTSAPPTYRYSPAAAAYGGYIYLVGGTSDVSGRGPIYPIAVYDPVADTWSSYVPGTSTPLAPLPTGRWGFDIAVIDGKLYAVGGAVNVPGNITTTSAYKITGITGTGTPVSTTITSHLTDGNHEYFFVTSVDSNGIESTPSSMVSTQINTTSGLGVDSSVAGNGQATLNWTVVSGATSYNLYYSTKPGVMPTDDFGNLPAGVTKITSATTTATTYTVTPLTNGTPYYFIVTAVTGTGEEIATKQEISVTPQATSSISGLSVTSNSTGSATLQWDAVSGAASYNIYYDTGNNIYYGNVDVYDPVVNSWSTGATMPTHRWGPTVLVVNGIIYAIGGWGGWPELSVVEAYDPVTDTWSTTVPTNAATMAAGTAGQPLTAMPTARDDFGFGVVNGKIFAIGGDLNTYNDATSTPCCTQVVEAYDTVNNTWTTSYPVMPTMRDDFDASVVDGIIYAIAGSRDGTFSDPTLTAAWLATYGGGYSLTNVEALSTSSIPVPTGVIATISTGQVTLNWTAISGATYNVYWSNKAGVSTAISTADGNVIPVTSNSYTHTGLTAGSWYYYVVTALTSSGESLPSNEVAIKAQ